MIADDNISNIPDDIDIDSDLLEPTNTKRKSNKKKNFKSSRLFKLLKILQMNLNMVKNRMKMII